jgi:integrase/recombinase XerC
MIDVGLTPATINRRLAAIRSALKLARTLGLTAWAPEIRGLKVEAYRDTTGPGVAGTRAMLVEARTQAPLKAARDVALIRLMFDLGLRRGEVTGLDLEDLEVSERRLWIRGKGRAQKEARTLPETTLASLTIWTEIRCQVVSSTEQAMFVGLAGRARGRRLTGRGLHHVIAELGAAVGLRTRPHGLRHASITAALDANNGDVRAVQLHARHADPQTTMRYDDNRQDLAGRVATSLANVL